MSMDLMIPSKADVPSWVLNPEAARAANEEAAAGISTGFPARVKLSAGKFVLVNGNGEESPFPASKLIIGPDENQYLPVIVLRAKKALQKSYYAIAFNPNSTEFVPPDCFSNDSEKPDITSPSAQSDLCATCQWNAFGSGKDQAGNATKGKACSDSKVLAVFVPGFGVHNFKIPAGSLKNFGLYVKQLSAAGIPLGTVKTLVGFDPTVSTQILVFKFGGYIPEASLPKLAELAQSIEVDEIIGGMTVAASAPKQIEKKAPPLPSPVDDLGLDGDAAVKAEAAEVIKKAAAAARKKAAAEKKAKEEAAAAAAEVQEPEVIDVGGRNVRELTDAQLAADLGL